MNRTITLSLLILTAAYFYSFAANSAPSSPSNPSVSEEPVIPPAQAPAGSSTMDELQQRQQMRQDAQATEFLRTFKSRFGYDPKMYELNFLESGNNVSVYDAAYWVKFHVEPETGLIRVQHTTAVRDIWWGSTVWYDHETTSVQFTLDKDACQAVSDGVNCVFTGKNEIRLNNFLANHQIIRQGIWDIKYIESKEERNIAFRVPKDAMPEGTKSGVSLKTINLQFCEVFPTGLNCGKEKAKSSP